MTTGVFHNDDPLLSDIESARYLGLSSADTLKQWRCKGRYAKELPATYIGRRVFYRRSALERFIAARTVRS